MYLNEYAASKIAESRLAELREERARIALLESLRVPRRGLAARLGAALIRAGQWLAGGEPVAGTGRGARRDWRGSVRPA